ncbi:MAG: porin [Balneolales bacterium]
MINKKIFLTLGIIAASCSFLFAQNNQSNDLSLNIGQHNLSGLINSRYEYTLREGNEDLSSFYLRRIRLDFQGHLFNDQISYRILPDFAQTMSLEVAWANYAYNDQAQFRFGLIVVPFHWHRFISSSRHHFVERGEPSENFGFPSGRDFGLMFHGRNDENTIAYRAGFFDGAGSKISQSNSSGNMVSARLVAAALGQVPRDETDFEFSESLNLAFGFGIQAANKNEVRDWSLGRSIPGNNRANWVSGTGDIHFRWMGFSLAADGYLRNVQPVAEVEDYNGWAYMVSSGYFISPNKLELVARYSDLKWDENDPSTQENEIGLGLNIYHEAHNLKTSIQYLSQFNQDQIQIGQNGYFVVEVQLTF